MAAKCFFCQEAYDQINRKKILIDPAAEKFRLAQASFSYYTYSDSLAAIVRQFS
jgi:hypothetical protein